MKLVVVVCLSCCARPKIMLLCRKFLSRILLLRSLNLMLSRISPCGQYRKEMVFCQHSEVDCAITKASAACQACCMYVAYCRTWITRLTRICASLRRRASKNSGLRVVLEWKACARLRLGCKARTWNDMVRGWNRSSSCNGEWAQKM